MGGNNNIYSTVTEEALKQLMDSDGTLGLTLSSDGLTLETTKNLSVAGTITAESGITTTTLAATGAVTVGAVLTVSPDGTNEVFQVNDGTIDFSDGNAGTAGTATIDSSGNISYNKDLTAIGITAATAKLTTGAGASKVLTSDAAGDATWENAPSGTVPDSGTDTEATLIGDGAHSWNVVSGIGVTAYGVRWDANAGTYAKGVIINRAGTFLPITYTDLPIQSQMRRCLLNDAGAVQYYLSATDSYNRAGVAPSETGTDDAGTASKVSDNGVFTGAEATYVGHYVHNTTDDTYAIITAKDSDDVLSIAYDIMDAAETFEICTADLGGTVGQVMVQIPQFYYVQHQDGDYRYFLIAQGPFRMILSTGETVVAVIHPAFYKGGSATASDYLYIGAYEGSMWDATTSAMVAPADIVTGMFASGDKLCSLSGEYPKTNETIVEFREMAEERGTGWHQFDHVSQSALAALYLTEFADFDSQTKIGDSRTALTNGDWVASEIHDGTNYGYIGLCGLSDGDGNVTNANNEATDLETTESPAYMSYRGIENWYGDVWKWLDGANINNDNVSSKLYLCTDYTDYASGTASNYTLAGNLAESDDYITDFLDANGIWPSSVGGISSTYVCDYYYTSFDTDPSGGWRVARVGGSADNGTSAGAFCVNAYYSSWYADASIGGRLCF